MAFQPAPPAGKDVTITGRISYIQGVLGLDRPARNSVNVNFLARDRTGAEHGLGTDTTAEDGTFKVFAESQFLPAHVTEIECLLRLQYAHSGTEAEIPLDPVNWGTGTTQSVGNHSFNWGPPEGAFAEVNGKPIEDVRVLADHLAMLLWDVSPRATSYSKVNIVLLRDPTPSADYTRAQQLFESLKQHELRKDFPELLIKHMESIPEFRSPKGPPTAIKTPSHDLLRNYLHRMSKFQLYQFEKGPMMRLLLDAAARSFHWIAMDPDRDAMPDAAAFAVLIYIAGRMSKDGGRMKDHTYGSRPLSWSQRQIKTVEMTVSR